MKNINPNTLQPIVIFLGILVAYCFVTDKVGLAIFLFLIAGCLVGIAHKK